jgi:hypothetical protein
MEVESFLLHPLLIHLKNNNTWECHTDLPDKDLYQIITKPILCPTKCDYDTFISNLHIWLDRRGIHVLHPKIGIVDIQHKIIYNVDIVAEREDQIVFIVFYQSENRWGGQEAKDAMLSYCKKIHTQTDKVYHHKVQVYLVNVYGSGKIVSTVIPSLST